MEPYGSPRFSEDLDVVGGEAFSTSTMLSMKSCIERYVGERYGLHVSVKEPRELAHEAENRHVKVHKWQIRVTTAPARRDLPAQMIKIEIAAIPAYRRVPQALQHNYDFLPDGYDDLVILVESLDEIMADKLVSLVNCTAYVRHRDIWDLHWIGQHGTHFDSELIRHKLADYHVAGYKDKAARLIERLPGIIHGKEFRDQMSRFIPLDVQERTLLKEKFLALLEKETIRNLTNAVKAAERQQRYRDVDDAVRRANDTEFGLDASVWGSDPVATSAVASRLQAGTVYINKHAEIAPHVPFGGIKCSGLGVEFAEEGLAAYTTIRIRNAAA